MSPRAPRSARVLLAWLAPAIGVLPACKPDGGLTKFNSPPEAQITAPGDGEAVLAGTAVTLRGAASDANHDASELSARWFVDGALVCPDAPPAADGTTTCDAIIPAAEAVELRLEVVDLDGAAGTARRTLAVTPNAAPTVEIASPVADTVHYSDQLITFRGTVADAEDAAADLEVWWEDGATRLDAVEATPNGSGEVLGYTTLGEGPHALELHARDTAGNESIATVLIAVGPPNTAPACAITAPADGGASEDGERVDFAATVSDVDVPADALSVEWASDKDGALGSSTPDSAGAVAFSTAALSVDTHRVTMTVRDEVGATCTSALTWTVGTPPSITLEAPLDGETANEGEALTFTALVADGEDVPGDLWVTWESDLDGVFHEGPADSAGVAETVETGLSRGTHQLTATVTDTAGLFTAARVGFVINGVPTAPAVSISPAAPGTTSDLRAQLDAAASDPDGDPLTYTYAWFRDGVPSGASASATLPASATARGEVWRVEVAATDGLATGPAGSASVTIANTAPALTGVAVSPASAAVGDTLTCSATATDADGETPTLTYAWSTGATGPTLAVPASADPGDTLTCTATATDGAGATATGSAAASVANTNPVVAGVAVSPATGRVGDVLTCTGSATDADGGTPSLSYAWSTGATTAAITLTAADDPGDTLTCTVTATDADGGVGTGSATAAVLNTLPAVAAVGILPATAYNDSTLTCSATATDADGGSPTLAYAWANTTRATALGSGPSLTLSPAAAAPGDAIACTATATDADAGSATASSTAVLANRAPSVTATLSPASPTRASTLVCTGSATDPDGDTPTLGFAWAVASSAVAASSGTATTSSLAGAFSAGQTVGCTATANDGRAGTATASASVTIGNTAPTVSVVLSPSTVYTNDTLTATATTADADGDPLSTTYDWYVDGSLVRSGAGSTLSGASFFDRDEVVTVTAQVSDGTTTASATSAGVTVRNTAPSAPGIEITPADPEAGDSLVCEVVTPSTDADGDPVGYAFAWDVDGVDYTDATDSTTDSVVDGADVGGGETWTCEVVAGDGTGSSTATTEAATVACEAGSSEYCPGLDCLDILTSEPTSGNGVYWIDPTGTNSYQVLCDMTTDGGGWTLVMKAVSDNYAYLDSLWTNGLTDNETDLSATATGKAKYQSFMEVEFTELRSSDPWNWSIDESHTVSGSSPSAHSLFTSTGYVISSTKSAHFNSRAASHLQSWGCTSEDRYGVNLYDVLGCRYVLIGFYCDWNGGARFGNRINAYYSSTGGQLYGQGWGAYYCSDNLRPTVDTGPIAREGTPAISELLWVR